MKRNDFDARLAHHLRSIGRETCSEADVHEYALMSIANAAAEKYEQVACNVQCVMDELP